MATPPRWRIVRETIREYVVPADAEDIVCGMQGGEQRSGIGHVEPTPSAAMSAARQQSDDAHDGADSEIDETEERLSDGGTGDAPRHKGGMRPRDGKNNRR